MKHDMGHSRAIAWQSLLLAVSVVAALFAWQGHIGLNLADEGYLWYGVQRVMHGEVPIRDFMAYDPGRYYWSAALMKVWGSEGIVALRGTVAIFQAAGLFAALLLIAKNAKDRSFGYLAVAAVILAAWMYPRHKLFDVSISIFLTFVVAYLIERPTVRRYFVTGLCVGIAAVFGRNHGVYGVAGSVFAILLVNFKGEEGIPLIKGASWWAAGIIVGYSPILLMAALVPHFASAFWHDVLFLFKIKTTNLTLPIPWPWKVHFHGVPRLEAVRALFVGMLFVALPVYGVLGLVWAFWRKAKGRGLPPGITASIVFALPYAHFAYSRADIPHLAQGIFPFLIGSLIIVETMPAKLKWISVAAVGGISLLIMLPLQPGYQCETGHDCTHREVDGDDLLVHRGTAANLDLLHKLVNTFAPDGRSFVVTPLWPGAYAVFDRKAPIWEIYAISPYRSANFQRKEIARIEKANPGFVLVIDMALDGRQDLRYRNTHPIMNRFFKRHYQRLDKFSPNPSYHIYVNPRAVH